jgi:hypothetical protein
VTNGTATISGPGPDREAEAAASLAATVAGVRRVHVAQRHQSDRSPDASSGSTPPGWTTEARVNQPSSGTGVDQL